MFKSEGEVQAQSWSPDGRWLAILATQRVGCEEVVLDDYCENLDLWIVNALNARRTLIHSFGPDGGDVSGVDWRVRADARARAELLWAAEPLLRDALQVVHLYT